MARRVLNDIDPNLTIVDLRSLDDQVKWGGQPCDGLARHGDWRVGVGHKRRGARVA